MALVRRVSMKPGAMALTVTPRAASWAAIAARTRRIRIGSPRVMLPHYSALEVAEQFRVLDIQID